MPIIYKIWPECYFCHVETDLQIKLLMKAGRYMRFVQMCPFVRFAAVCNNAAMGRVHEGSDIDLFFVMKKGGLFTGRFFVTLLLHLLGVRRHGGKVAGRFCLSFFMDDSDLDLSKIAIENDYYLAYWCKTMIPFIDRGIIERFENSNGWVPGLKLRRDYLLPDKKPFLESISFPENFLASWQKKRILRKINRLARPHGIIANDHMLKFHDVDRRAVLRDEIKAISGILLQ